MFLAQCFGAADCQLPTSPPWWLSVAFVAGWLTLVAGIVVLAAWRIRARANRRRPPGTDLQRYPREEIEPY